MTKFYSRIRISALFFGVAICFFCYSSLNWSRLIKREEELSVRKIRLESELANIVKLESLIKAQRTLSLEARKKGFFMNLPPRTIVARVKSIAANCHIPESEVFFERRQLNEGGLCVSSLKLIVGADLDLDVFRLIYQLERENLGIVLIKEINLLRMDGDSRLHGEIQFDIISSGKD